MQTNDGFAFRGTALHNFDYFIEVHGCTVKNFATFFTSRQNIRIYQRTGVNYDIRFTDQTITFAGNQLRIPRAGPHKMNYRYFLIRHGSIARHCFICTHVTVYLPGLTASSYIYFIRLNDIFRRTIYICSQ